MPCNVWERVWLRSRRHHCGTDVSAGSANVNFTISIGVTTRIADTLEETISRADELLYQAKEEGRNRVILD